MNSSNNNCGDNNNNNKTHDDDIVVLAESGTLECREPEQQKQQQEQQQQGRESDARKRGNEDGEVLIDANNYLKKEEGATAGILNGAAAPKTQNPAAVNMVMLLALKLTTQ